MTIELLIPLGAFAMITISVALVCRLIATASLNKTIREALRSDPGSVPVLAGRLEERQPWADALLGWIFLAVAAAILGLSLFEETGDQREMWKVAMVAAVVGVTVLVYVFFAARRATR